MKPVELERFLERLKAQPPMPEPAVEYLCAACEDTGWVEVDDGLEDGRRVRSATEARCTSLVHERKPAREVQSTPERFS
jgi:hypothetical protein